jgi:hypothetical protein
MALVPSLVPPTTKTFAYGSPCVIKVAVCEDRSTLRLATWTRSGLLPLIRNTSEVGEPLAPMPPTTRMSLLGNSVEVWEYLGKAAAARVGIDVPARAIKPARII